MKPHLLGCALLVAVLAACASHPPRCHGRLTPINRRPLQRQVSAGPGPDAAHAPEARHS